MSAGYGYYRMEFYKNDGTPDETKAKEAFDFCMKQYEWVREVEPFVMEDNSIIGNYCWLFTSKIWKSTKIPCSRKD